MPPNNVLRARRPEHAEPAPALGPLASSKSASKLLHLIRIFIVSNTIWIRETNSPSPYPLPKEREHPRQTVAQPEALGHFERCSPGLPLLGERVG